MDIGKQLLLKPEQTLAEHLQNEEYRRAFVEAQATDTIAFQLREMRKARAWEQKDVAEKLGNRKLQPMISRYESPDYGKYSVTTLLELAAAFDVALAVRFVPFSELVDWDISTGPSKRLPECFSDDEKLKEMLNGTSNRVQGATFAAGSISQKEKASASMPQETLQHQEKSTLAGLMESA